MKNLVNCILKFFTDLKTWDFTTFFSFSGFIVDVCDWGGGSRALPEGDKAGGGGLKDHADAGGRRDHDNRKYDIRR